MRTNIIAAALMLGASLAACDVEAGSRSFSSSSRSSYSSSSSYSSRSYSSPSRSYSSPARSYSSPTRTTTITRTTTVSKPRAVTPVVNRTTVINKTVVITKPSKKYSYKYGNSYYPKYSYYTPSARPSYVSNDTGWYAFGALAAYMILSDDQRANVPMPDTSGLTSMTWAEISRAVWADDSLSRAEVRILNEWKRLNAVAN